MDTTLLITLGVIILIGMLSVGWFVGIYNTLVTLRNRFKNAYAQIDVQLKRRYDLIPNLVETAKAYMAHEQGTLQAVIAARNQAASLTSRAAADPTDAGAMRQLMAAESNVAGSLGKLMVTVEAYPELKANTTMQQLMEEISSTENKISFARQAFNDGVMVYNNGREVFPNNFIAAMFNFQAAVAFEITNETEREAPKVSFAK